MTLRFPEPGSSSHGDPYKPEPEQLPHIHAFISLYALNPSPPTQPGALPALPTLLAANGQKRAPRLITLYPAGSVLPTPDTFASQMLTQNHLLLQRNLVASTRASFVSIFIGHLQLPPFAEMLRLTKSDNRQLTFRQQIEQTRGVGKLQVVKQYVFGGLGAAWSAFTGYLNFGAAAQDYRQFERCVLRSLKSRETKPYLVGQYSFLALMMGGLHPRSLGVLAYLPTMPGATGPISAAGQGIPTPRKPLSSVRSATSSTSGSDHEGGEDLVSSRHTVTSDESVSGGSATGLDASWVGVEAGN